jgi:thioredoxin 1
MQSTEEWESLSNASTPVIIQFAAEWCGPCQALKPKMKEAVNKMGGKVKCLYVDVDKFPQQAEALKVLHILINCV